MCFSPDGSRIFTAGGPEGIYEWEFLGDLSKHERTVDFSEYLPVNMKKLPLTSSTYQPNNVKRSQQELQQPLFEDVHHNQQYQYNGMEDEEDIEIEQALKIAPTAIDSPFKIGRVVTDVNEI